MKKIMIILALTIISLIMYTPPPVHAEAVLVSEPAADTGGLWHVQDENRVYVFMRYAYDGTVIETGSASNETNSELDLSLYTKWYGLSGQLSFPYTSLYNNYAALENPDPEYYDQFVVEMISHMEAPAAEYKTVSIFDEVVNEIEVNLYPSDWATTCTMYMDYSYITLSVDGTEVLSSKNFGIDDAASCGGTANPYAEDLFFGVRMYWEHTEVVETIDPVTDDNPWNALPATTGSPVNPDGYWGYVSNIVVDQQEISFDVNYQGTTYPVSTFSVDGDLDFIDKSNDVLYYTDPDNGDRILYFNFGETIYDAILATRTFSTVNEWKGEALWNLTQNEIKVTDVIRVYNYIPEVDADGNVFSYFYMPDVPIDDLISVTGVLAFRYWDDGFLWTDPEPGDIQYKTVAAVKGETTTVNELWFEKVYQTAYITESMLNDATINGISPGYGWVIAGGVLVLVNGTILVHDVTEWFAYDIEQIEHVIPSIVLTNEINNYIAEVGGDDQFSPDIDKLYKLHLATLQDGDEVEVMSDYSNIIQVVWQTDGEIYVLNEDYIDNIPWGGPGTLVPVDMTANDDLEILMWVGVGVVGLYLFTKLKLDKKPGLLIIILAAAAYYLYKIGLL